MSCFIPIFLAIRIQPMLANILLKGLVAVIALIEEIINGNCFSMSCLFIGC